MDALTDQQALAVAELIAGATADQAGASVGVTGRTVRRWLETEPFQRAIADAQRELWREVSRTLARHGCAAVACLASILGDQTAPAGSRVSAARTVLEQIRADQDRDLERRVEALERLLGGRLCE